MCVVFPLNWNSGTGKKGFKMIPKWIYELMAEHRGRCLMTPPKGLVAPGVSITGLIKDDSYREQDDPAPADRAYPGYEDFPLAEALAKDLELQDA